jgi:hypothetical protein
MTREKILQAVIAMLQQLLPEGAGKSVEVCFPASGKPHLAELPLEGVVLGAGQGIHVDPNGDWIFDAYADLHIGDKRQRRWGAELVLALNAAGARYGDYVRVARSRDGVRARILSAAPAAG